MNDFNNRAKTFNANPTVDIFLKEAIWILNLYERCKISNC